MIKVIMFFTLGALFAPLIYPFEWPYVLASFVGIPVIFFGSVAWCAYTVIKKR